MGRIHREVKGLQVRWLGVAMLLVGLLVHAGACAAFAEARLVVTPGHVNLGLIEEGVRAKVSVLLENAGDSPLTITGVRTN